RCFQRGAERFLEEPQGAVYYASAMHNLAGITPDLEARLALLQEGEAYARRGGTPEILTMSLALQCRCLTDLGRPQQAEAKGRAALRRAERNNKVSTLGRVLYHLAPAQAALGDIDDALTTLDRSHAIFASAQDAGYVAAVAAQRGLILREAGRLGAARDAYETAIETHRALNLSRMLFGSLCGLAIVQARRGEDPSALLEEAKALLNGFELPPDSPMWQELQDAASVAIAAG
ncbi:MAG: tetratricopeptide repeat protein, partial [Myxococcota bacterium]